MPHAPHGALRASPCRRPNLKALPVSNAPTGSSTVLYGMSARTRWLLATALLVALLVAWLPGGEPGAQALLERISSLAGDLDGMAGCFVVVTDHKLRVKRP